MENCESEVYSAGIHRVSVPVYENCSLSKFKTEIYHQRVPCVLRGLDLGPCTRLWQDPHYLASRAAPDPHRPVQVHVSTCPRLDFCHRNFSYKTLPFSDFIQRCSNNGKLAEYFFDEREYYYLRSVGCDPRKEVSTLEEQYPDLARDLRVPEVWEEPTQVHSTVLRVGSPGTQLWTHYDIMDNILIHITGSKHAVLFRPQDQDCLYMKGDKSTVLDVDAPDVTKHPKFLNATQHHAHLQPGDVLFIPALWFHNIRSGPQHFTCSVNVFWRHLPQRHYQHRDLYGNKDLVEGTRALELVGKACGLLATLPQPYRHFYHERVARRCAEGRAAAASGSGSAATAAAVDSAPAAPHTSDG